MVDCKDLMIRSKYKVRKVQWYFLETIITVAPSSGILGSPEKGEASYPECPAGGAVSEQICPQALCGKVFSKRQVDGLGTRAHLRCRRLWRAQPLHFPKGDPKTKMALLCSCSHERTGTRTQPTCLLEGASESPHTSSLLPPMGYPTHPRMGVGSSERLG